MTFLAVLATTVAFVALCKPLIKQYPVVFYALALAADGLFILCAFGYAGGIIEDAVYLLIQKCTLALALFVVVMFIGAFPADSKIRSYLSPIRAELSIIACILSIGHLAVYSLAYVPRLAGGAFPSSVLASLIIAAILTILLTVLGITSFTFVKKRMSKRSWKNLQRFAYLFFGLIFVHLMLLLTPAALAGGSVAQTSITVYCVIFGLYAIMRIYRAFADKKAMAK